MKNYQLELRQIVDFPRCRIYREFVQDLLTDRSIRTGGCSGLFYFVVLCSYANFRTSYRRIDGISYTVYPGEWICSIYQHIVCPFHYPPSNQQMAADFLCHIQHSRPNKIQPKMLSIVQICF